MNADSIHYKVGFLGIPNSQDRFQICQSVAWDQADLARLQRLGFDSKYFDVDMSPWRLIVRLVSSGGRMG